MRWKEAVQVLIPTLGVPLSTSSFAKVKKMSRFWSILLSFLLSPWVISTVDGKRVLDVPECNCDGTDWFVETSQMSSHICGRYSMCSFDMHFYLTNMKGVVIPEGVKPAEEYKQNYTRVMTSFGYPFDLSVDRLLPECRNGFQECLRQKDLLIFSECDRLRPQFGKKWANLPRKGPYLAPSVHRPHQFEIDKADLMWNGWWTMVDNTGPKTRPRFFYMDPRFIMGACPHYLHRPTFTMAVLLWQFSKIEFHENLAPHFLLSLLHPYIIRAMHCKIFSLRFDILYFVYNATEFCNDWNVTSTYACIILNENPSDREQRDVVKDCGGPRLPPNYEQQVDYTDQIYADGLGSLPNFENLEEEKEYPESPWDAPVSTV